MRFVIAVILCVCLMLTPCAAALAGLTTNSEPSPSDVVGPAGKNLYVLSIGVDKYDAPELNLRLAIADARAFLEAITEHGRGLYRNVYSKLLTDPGVSDIESAFESVIRSANPQDTFVLYYAGSGSEIVLSGDANPYDKAADKTRGIRYQPSEQEINSLDTILPTRTISNLKDKQNVLANSITGRQLTSFCSRILANRQILILDSCYSSASIPNVQKLLLTKPERDGVGRSIAVIGLASSEDESLALGHGQLTKAILEGLSGKSDPTGMGEISIKALQAFVEKNAPKLGNANMTPIKVATFLHGNDFIIADYMQQRDLPQPSPADHSARNETKAKTRDLSFDNAPVLKTHLLQPAHCCKAIFFASDVYKDSALKSLSNPISDVEAIAKVLETRYGWNCEIHRNPTIAEIRAALTKQRESKYNPDCELLLYFAGHGSFVKDINHGFIAASDSPQTPNKDSWFSHSELIRYVTGSESPHTLLIVDACFGAALGRAFQDLIETDFKRSSNSDEVLQSVELQTDVYRDLNLREYYGQIFATRPTQWCVVSGTGAVPDGDEKKHSPFARKFLETLTQGSEKGFLTRRDVEAALELVGSGPISSDIPGVTSGGPFVFLSK